MLSDGQAPSWCPGAATLLSPPVCYRTTQLFAGLGWTQSGEGSTGKPPSGGPEFFRIGPGASTYFGSEGFWTSGVSLDAELGLGYSAAPHSLMG
jgi:hypothetical protein